LVFSRLQQRTLQLAPTDASELLRLVLTQLAAEVRAARAEVTVEPLGEVYADPKLLALVFRHLLDNAIKFRRSDAPLRIAVVAAHDGETWRVHVCDNGSGVAPGLQEKAFGMFRRLHGEGLYPGVGAGLAICRRIARRHGGELVFVDRAQGACLELSLPLGRQRQDLDGTGAPT
jgi:signal transduction histidine kinase